MSEGTWIYVGGFELPDLNAAAHRVQANAKILQQLGYKVILVGVRKHGGKGLVRYPDNYAGCECWSVRYPVTKFQWVRYVLGTDELNHLLTSNSLDFRGVICYNYPAIAQLRLFKTSKRLGGKNIADLTEWYEVGAGALPYQLAKWFDTFSRMRIVNRLADGIIAISPMLARFYAKRGMNVVQIPPLFDTETLRPPTSEGRAGCPIRVIYIGSPFTVKRVRRDRRNVKDRLDVCVELFGRLADDGADFVFDIYGVTRDEYVATFGEHKKVLDDNDDRIRFHGRVPNKVAIANLQNSDYSIFIRDPTRVTLAGFPTKLAESLTAGIPVITSRHPNVEAFASTPGLFLLERGNEYVELAHLISSSATSLREVKITMSHARTFDFRNYVDVMRQFLEGKMS